MTAPPAALNLQFMSQPQTRFISDLHSLSNYIAFLIQDAGLAGSSPEQKDSLLQNLSHITEQQLIQLGEKDSSCPICFTSYLAIIAEEELATVMDSPAHATEHLGVTKLSQPWQCGHMFCRKDIMKWITDGHDSCPLCRRLLIKSKVQDPTCISNAAEPADIGRGINDTQEVFSAIENAYQGLMSYPESSIQTHNNGEQTREYSGMFS